MTSYRNVQIHWTELQNDKQYFHIDVHVFLKS